MCSCLLFLARAKSTNRFLKQQRNRYPRFSKTPNERRSCASAFPNFSRCSRPSDSCRSSPSSRSTVATSSSIRCYIRRTRRAVSVRRDRKCNQSIKTTVWFLFRFVLIFRRSCVVVMLMVVCFCLGTWHRSTNSTRIFMSSKCQCCITKCVVCHRWNRSQII